MDAAAVVHVGTDVRMEGDEDGTWKMEEDVGAENEEEEVHLEASSSDPAFLEVVRQRTDSSHPPVSLALVDLPSLNLAAN